MDGHGCHLVVVEARTFDLSVVDLEAQWLDQVELTAGIRRQPDGVAGIGGNGGLEEHYAEHGGEFSQAVTPRTHAVMEQWEP